MAEGKVKMAEEEEERAKKRWRRRGERGERMESDEGVCQVSGFGGASVHSSPLYLG